MEAETTKYKIEMTDKEAALLWDVLNEAILNCKSKEWKRHAKLRQSNLEKAMLKAGMPGIPKSDHGHA